ncbi:MAG: hypothetical protein WCL11_05530 [Verrucomicrobiota bacterium]
MTQFDSMLELMMPNKRPALRKKLFADFVRYEIAELRRKVRHPIDDGELVRSAQAYMDALRQEGVNPDQARGYFERFRNWHASAVSAKRQASAAKRWSADKEQKRLAAQQAKRKKSTKVKTVMVSYDTVDEWDREEETRTPIRKTK